MAEAAPNSRGNTPTIPTPKLLTDDHAPAISSPLNPDAPPLSARPSKPLPREQREKRESLKKRESTKGRGGTPDGSRGKGTHAAPGVPSPMRYSINEPKLSDFDTPRDVQFASHEPIPFTYPSGEEELKRPLDLAENKRGFRYALCVADPLFRHKQYYRQTEVKPYGPCMSFNDSDKSIHFNEAGRIVTNEKGWRLSKANVCAREGTSYFEVKIIRGVPQDSSPIPVGGETTPQPHIRAGWARREAPLDAPVGFDGYSYGITDIRIDTIHRSRPGRIFHPSKSKSKTTTAKNSKSKTADLPQPSDAIREGDILGLELTLPPLSLHRKVVTGMYNPAVDNFDPRSTGTLDPSHDIIRDRIPVAYKGHMYFEHMDYVSSKAMESYADRGPFNKITPNPNHEDAPLRSLPQSSIRVYKNGRLLGTAFENLLAFLPPASQPSAAQARLGFDDAMLGYFPAVAAFTGGTAEVNFGPEWWAPPERAEDGKDARVGEEERNAEGSMIRGVGERFKEQIAEDILWDVVDEADFFVQDGGYAADEGKRGTTQGMAKRVANLQEANE
ncbi:MAG: hypothetical protein M1820_003242 [Bogoriella megaspora]|nr:MAG: hypothetical protein M1820_003242 [Bogoriella megaspora]